MKIWLTLAPGRCGCCPCCRPAGTGRATNCRPAAGLAAHAAPGHRPAARARLPDPGASRRGGRLPAGRGYGAAAAGGRRRGGGRPGPGPAGGRAGRGRGHRRVVGARAGQGRAGDAGPAEAPGAGAGRDDRPGQLGGRGRRERDPGVLTTVALACRDTERIRFSYTAAGGERTGRHVEPHRLVLLGRRWYLAGYDLDPATGGGVTGSTGSTRRAGTGPGSGRASCPPPTPPRSSGPASRAPGPDTTSRPSSRLRRGGTGADRPVGR